jgi:hypothetical protein
MSDPPARQFPYSLPDGTLDELDSLPRLPLTLHYRDREQRVDAIGLVDSGATVNVLPYRVGLALGALWSAQRATLRLAGNLAHVPAQPLIVSASIADFTPVQLAFAWTQAEDLPLILGQVNFFMVFEVCFFRAQSLFALRQRGAG